MMEGRDVGGRSERLLEGERVNGFLEGEGRFDVGGSIDRNRS